MKTIIVDSKTVEPMTITGQVSLNALNMLAEDIRFLKSATISVRQEDGEAIPVRIASSGIEISAEAINKEGKKNTALVDITIPVEKVTETVTEYDRPISYIAIKYLFMTYNMMANAINRAFDKQMNPLFIKDEGQFIRSLHLN